MTRQPFDPSLDLLAVAGEDGFLYEMGGHGLAGQGEALRLALDYAGPADLPTVLEKVSVHLAEVSDEAVAFVAVPFTNTRPVLAVVPEVVVHRNETEAWAQAFGDGEIPSHFELPTPMRPPTSFTTTAQRSPKEWCDVVAEAVTRMRRGQLSKAAIAREILVEADAPLSQVAALTNLRRSYPSSFLYAIDGLVGASPELLIERVGCTVHARALAGTLPRSTDVDTDLALQSMLLHHDQQFRSEHRFLADMIRDTLSPFCEVLDVPATPGILSLANVHHLSTQVRGTLTDNAASVLELVAALHPTPAVGGTPTQSAMDLIAELEELDRGYYAGAVGWVDASGNGSFAVAIRCAQISGTRARVIAGNGIVAGSDPQRELEETRWKLQVMLCALIRP